MVSPLDPARSVCQTPIGDGRRCGAPVTFEVHGAVEIPLGVCDAHVEGYRWNPDWTVLPVAPATKER